MAKDDIDKSKKLLDQGKESNKNSRKTSEII
jgi:hypothetical protein